VVTATFSVVHSKRNPLKRLAQLFGKLLLLCALVVASLPSGATEMVCVLKNGETIRPIGKCQMACCAHRPTAEAKPTKRSCCSPKLAPAKKNLCGSLKRDCHCETRFTGAAPKLPATADVFHLDFPQAIAPLPTWTAPAPLASQGEPGVVGFDSGPPRRRPRTPNQSRAPPVRS